jgi:hypothetical protein
MEATLGDMGPQRDRETHGGDHEEGYTGGAQRRQDEMSGASRAREARLHRVCGGTRG